MNFKKILIVGIVIIIISIVAIVIWFAMPASPLKNKFQKVISEDIKENELAYGNIANNIYTEEEIQKLPEAIQEFFRYSGLIGKNQTYISHITYADTDFKLSQDKPSLKIKYEHYNMLNRLDRVAAIDTSLMGIPFDGLDNYTNGKGSMTGMLAKSITLFNSTGTQMDESCLVTTLSEMVFLPTIALQDYVIWESIDDNNAKATITYNGYTVSAVFTINDLGEIIRIETDNRYIDEGDGNSSKHKWVIDLSDYIEENGIKHPSKAKATWKLSTGDYTYFDGKGISIDYNVKQ